MSASLTTIAATECDLEDERRLVERARHDPTALAALYRLHIDAIHGYVARRVGNAHEADDLTAEVFLTMVRSLPRFRWLGVPFRAWLYRLATNEVNRWARKRRRRAWQQFKELSANEIAVDHAKDHVADLDRVQTALLSLPPRFQTALSLYYLEGLSTSQIAVALGCREGTVKSRLSRGRNALRPLLERSEHRHE
jgi:RNA polymerase sigma-70 factor, ECF subfamily